MFFFFNISRPLQWSLLASMKYTIMSTLFVLDLSGLSIISDVYFKAGLSDFPNFRSAVDRCHKIILSKPGPAEAW